MKMKTIVLYLSVMVLFTFSCKENDVFKESEQSFTINTYQKGVNLFDVTIDGELAHGSFVYNESCNFSSTYNLHTCVERFELVFDTSNPEVSDITIKHKNFNYSDNVNLNVDGILIELTVLKKNHRIRVIFHLPEN